MHFCLLTYFFIIPLIRLTFFLIRETKSFLLYIGDEPRKETFKSAMADFVINELVIEQIKTDTGHSKRMYAYYKKLMDYYKNSPHNSQESIIENRYVPNENVSFENEDAINGGGLVVYLANMFLGSLQTPAEFTEDYESPTMEVVDAENTVTDSDSRE